MAYRLDQHHQFHNSLCAISSLDRISGIYHIKFRSLFCITLVVLCLCEVSLFFTCLSKIYNNKYIHVCLFFFDFLIWVVLSSQPRAYFQISVVYEILASVLFNLFESVDDTIQDVAAQFVGKMVLQLQVYSCKTISIFILHFGNEIIFALTFIGTDDNFSPCDSCECCYYSEIFSGKTARED